MELSQNSQERPEALREAARAMLHVRTPNEVAAAGSATVIDLAEGRITAGYASAVSSLLGRISEASFLHHISEKEKAPAGPEGIMAGVFDAMVAVTRSSGGNGHREAAREPGHPIRQETMDRAQRRSHENRLEEQRRELERQRQQVAANHQRAVAEQRRIEADQASVERELSRVRSEEYACGTGDPTLMGAR